MIVTYEQAENRRRHSKDDLILKVEFDNNINIVKKYDNYDDIDTYGANEFCSMFEKHRKLSLDEYKFNVDVMHQIYRETISKHNLVRIIKEFPRQSNGTFKKNRTVIIAKSMNAKYNKKLDMYECSCIIVYSKNAKTLEIQYRTSSFI